MFILLTLGSFRYDTSEPYYHGLTGLIHFNFFSFADKIDCLRNLGLVCFRMDKKDKAVEFFEDALEQARKFYGGKPHLTLVDVLISLGAVLRSQSVDFVKKCLQYFQEAKKMMYEILGPNHAHSLTSAIFQSMGKIFYELDDLAMAQQYLQDALNMNFVICRKDSVNDATAEIYSYLGLVSEKFGNLNQAKEYYGKGVKTISKLVSLGNKKDSSTDLFCNLYKLSSICEALGQEDEALGLLREAIEIEKGVGSETWPIWDALLRVGIDLEIGSFAKLLVRFQGVQAASHTAEEDIPPELLKYRKLLKHLKQAK